MSVRQASSPESTPGLRAGSVHLWGDVVAAITNVAPSASVALTLGALVSIAGLAAPSVMLLVGIAMLCIAIAYNRLNFWAPSAAAQALWVARSIRPVIGLALGIMILIESIVSNIANATLFGPYLLGIVWPQQANNGILEFAVSVVFVGLVLVIALEGIRGAIRFQTYIVLAEYVIIIGFALALLHAELAGHPGSVVPHFSWLLPTKAPSFGAYVTAVAIAVFAFGGWESAVYLAEETTDGARHPGRAGVFTAAFCTVWFLFLFLIIDAIAPIKDLVAHQANVIAYAASLVLPQPWPTVVSLAVLSSVVAVVQSQLQVFSRMSFGLARDGLLPRILTRISRTRVPWVGLVVSAIIPVVLLAVYLLNSSAAQVLTLVTGSAGILYLAMYVVGAIACIWYFRRAIVRRVNHLVFAGMLPAIGVIVLLVALFAAIPSTAVGTLIPAAVFVFVGIPIAYWIKSRTHHEFFDIIPAVADVTEEEIPGSSASGER